MSADYIIREFVKPINVLCVIYDLVWFPGNFFQNQKKMKEMQFLGFEFFCMTSKKSYKSYMTLYEY